MNRIILVILIINCAISIDSKAQYSEWYKDTTFQNIDFQKIRFKKGNESLYAHGVLKKKTIIDGYPCHKNIILAKEALISYHKALCLSIKSINNWLLYSLEMIVS